MINDKHFWTPKEIAKLLCVSPMTIYRLIETGKLPAVQIGRSIRVSDDALQSYIRSNCVVVTNK